MEVRHVVARRFGEMLSPVWSWPHGGHWKRLYPETLWFSFDYNSPKNLNLLMFGDGLYYSYI